MGREFLVLYGVIIKQTKRKVIVWGLGRSGKFLTQLLSERTKIKIDIYIDEKIYIYGDEKRVRRSTILNYLNSNDYIILSTVRKYDEVLEKVSSFGYINNVTVFNVYERIGESYLDVLCNSNEGLDFSALLSKDNAFYDNENMEHTAVSFPNIDRIFERISQIQSKKRMRFIDLGCGKGGALVLAKMFGIQDVSGVELIEDLYNQALENMRILGLDCNIHLGNVLDFNFDEYDFFYLYNPFRGNVFKKTIENIEDSYARSPRTIHIYYGNPFEHKTVVANGVFELIEQFETDFYDPIANLYISRCKND